MGAQFIDESNLYSIVYFFLQSFLRWERNILSIPDLEYEQQGLANEVKSLKAKLMNDSDQFFMMVFKIKRNNYEETIEESKAQHQPDLTPDIIKSSRKYVSHSYEINLMIFFSLLKHYNREELLLSFESIPDSFNTTVNQLGKRNLREMLENLRSNLMKVGQNNPIEFKKPF